MLQGVRNLIIESVTSVLKSAFYHKVGSSVSGWRSGRFTPFRSSPGSAAGPWLRVKRPSRKGLSPDPQAKAKGNRDHAERKEWPSTRRLWCRGGSTPRSAIRPGTVERRRPLRSPRRAGSLARQSREANPGSVPVPERWTRDGLKAERRPGTFRRDSNPLGGCAIAGAGRISPWGRADRDDGGTVHPLLLLEQQCSSRRQVRCFSTAEAPLCDRKVLGPGSARLTPHY